MDLEDLRIGKLVVHKIGNQMRDEGIQPSQNLHDLGDSVLNELILKYFLKPFKQDRFYNFFHESELNLNEVYYYVSKVFIDNQSFYKESINILKHLYENSSHPHIKSGEFYMVYFKNYSVTEKRIDVIGLFKSENKDTFLKINQEMNNFNIDYDKGININKLDKGCLIFNEKKEGGYKVLIVDTVSKSHDKEAQYWKKNFLNLKEHESENYNTRNFIQMCNEFSSNVFEGSVKKDTQDKIKFKNSTYQYLEENDSYNINEFVDNVFDTESIKNEFKEYRKKYEEVHQITPSETFEISKNTVSQMKRKFQSFIKLDTGFDIKVTNPNHLEKGYDSEKGMYYYKLFYNNEN